ncbi:hypothetical protein JCM10213_008266 [Rhodosporidiobolus nylandii]
MNPPQQRATLSDTLLPATALVEDCRKALVGSTGEKLFLLGAPALAAYAAYLDFKLSRRSLKPPVILAQVDKLLFPAEDVAVEASLISREHHDPQAFFAFLLKQVVSRSRSSTLVSPADLRAAVAGRTSTDALGHSVLIDYHCTLAVLPPYHNPPEALYSTLELPLPSVAKHNFLHHEYAWLNIASGPHLTLHFLSHIACLVDLSRAECSEAHQVLHLDDDYAWSRFCEAAEKDPLLKRKLEQVRAWIVEAEKEGWDVELAHAGAEYELKLEEVRNAPDVLAKLAIAHDRNLPFLTVHPSVQKLQSLSHHRLSTRRPRASSEQDWE